MKSKFQSAASRWPTAGLNVAVIGANAEPVSGLTADQFTVFEDGVPQQVQFFWPGVLPLDVIIPIDTSASMTGSMALVQQAAARLARALRPEDRAAVMGISNGLFPVALLELNGIYDTIATELSHQYSLGDQPTNVTRDGSFRRIALKISVPGVQWRTRSGYLAERTSIAVRGDEQ